MLTFLKKLFGKKDKRDEVSEADYSEEEYKNHYELKKKGLENVLGKMHDFVGHAVIPFSLGGSVDLYYFPQHIKGTGFATMELIQPDGTGPQPNQFGTYEFVAFTRHPYFTSDDPLNPFMAIQNRVCGIFTKGGFYSFNSVLRPKETCEIPLDDGKNICMVLENYMPKGKYFMVGDRKHHLLLCMEILESEMNFAREYGSDELLRLLTKAGYYPYSDMDRKPVA